MIKVWLYSFGSLFFLGVMLAAEHAIGGQTRFMGESLGLVIILLSCQVCFHLNGVNELSIDSRTQIFLQKISKSFGVGLIVAALLFYVFHKFFSAYAAASACFLIFGLVVVRPIVRTITKGTDPLTAERASAKILIEEVACEQEILPAGAALSRVYLGFKRAIDLALSIVLLALTTPVMVLVALAIRLESRGPVIFKQERVGYLGQKFTVYKFRSMREDAETLSGPIWAKEKDDRVTRIGAILRKCRLDELPQIVNVIRGEMSFTGPRPERPYFVDLLKTKIPYYDLRHRVKPGITGWAQVMYRYGASVEDAFEKLQYDLYYAKHASLSFDLRILLKTFKVVIAGEGR